jgi:hypothetical protein
VSGISGFVLDTGFRVVGGARVEVIDGPQAGMSSTVDATGTFSLTGTFDSTTRFRATKDGYVTATQTWSCSVDTCGGQGASPWLGFYLASSLAAPVDIAGDYTLTFIADSACTDLPDEVRTRTYEATIVPSSIPNIPADTAFKVTVAGASFLSGFADFGIGVVGDHVDLWLDGGHDPPLVEQLAPNTYLAFSGNATVSVAAPISSISASLDGWIDYCVLKTPMGSHYNCGTDNTGAVVTGQAVTRAHCDSTNHRLILTRR